MKINEATEDAQRRTHSPLVFALLLIHTGLLGWSAYRYSPTEDEIAHLPAGLMVWKYGATNLYNVNPPLARTVAALPVLFMDHELVLDRYSDQSSMRSEWAIGNDFLIVNQSRLTPLFTATRLACLPFSLLGLWMCWLWGRDAISGQGGVVAATLWCFSPNILGHGSLITPDVPAVAMGLLAAYRFQQWTTNFTLRNAFFAGITFGLALLTKTYWIFLFGLWPLILLLCHSRHAKEQAAPTRTRWLQLCVIFALALNVVWVGFLGRGIFTPLKEYNFHSAALAGEMRLPGKALPGNRFADSWLGNIPVPLPRDYVTGIDLQKLDFERGHWSYLLGEVKDPGGWWHYYLVGLLVKVPVGTWLLVGIGGCLLFFPKRNFTLIKQTLPYWLPVLCLFTIASLNVKMNRHVRYVFPMLPCLYLLAAYAVQQSEAFLKFKQVTYGCVGLVILASLSIYPHSLSFFNYAVGGPNQGGRYLIDSNLDWGQDNWLLQEWLEQNPERRPVFAAGTGYCSLRSYGIEVRDVQRIDDAGWYVISRHRLYDPNYDFESLREQTPVERIGYTYNIYLIEQSTTEL